MLSAATRLCAVLQQTRSKQNLAMHNRDITVIVGDALDVAADVLISTANPWLNMSGGVNGAIVEREPGVQSELRAHLESIGESAIPAGSVVRTSAGSLPFSHIIHAVGIVPFSDSSHQLVTETLTAAFSLAVSLGAKSIAMPTLATGYGPMTIDEFARAFVDAGLDRFPLDSVTIVVRSVENAATINSVFATSR